MALSDILATLDAQGQADQHKEPFLPSKELPVVNQDDGTQQTRPVRVVDGDTVHIAPEQEVRTGGIGQAISDFWHSYDGKAVEGTPLEGQGESAPAGRNYRQRNYNAMDKGLVGRDFAKEINNTMADRVLASDDESGSHGRGRATVINRHGEDVGMDILRLGVGATTTEWGYSTEAQAAFDSGVAAQALGLRKTNTPELAWMEERLAKAKRYNPLQIPVPGDTAVPSERSQGTLGDSVDRGKDGLDLTAGAALEWVGERTGLDGLRDYGKGVRKENTLEAAANPSRVQDFTAIFNAKPGEKMDAAADYFVESLGENAVSFLPDLLATVVTGGAGGLASAAGRRALTRSLTTRFGSEAAARVMAQAPAAFSRSSFTKGAAVGQFASGAVQEVGIL